jgi:type IV pilus assembly protein PilB
VLSTLHTNDAAGAVTRLLEMGVEPALLNATLLAILAQRLVRRNCPHCIQEESPEPLERKMLGVTEDEVFYKGVGCEHCNNTGYLGRLAVYELLTLTPALREQIAKGEPVDVLRAQAIKDGMVPLTLNALIQARQRKTSLAEVYRVRLE